MERLKEFFWNIIIQDAKKEPISTLVQNIPEKGIILDAGSGEGQYTRVLNNTGRTIICLDIKLPKKRPPENDYILGSVECLPFKNEVFDFEYSMSVLQFVKNDKASFEEFHRTLKTGGRLVFTVPTKYSIFHFLRELELFFNVYGYPEFNVPHHHYYSKTRIKHLSSKFFSLVKLRGYNFNFFYPRLWLLIMNLCKKYHVIQSKSRIIEENTNIDHILVKYSKESTNHLFWIFDLFSQFFNCFAWHYVVVSERE